MGTQGSGRKRAPLKDRFSAEDEALSSIAREAEARLAAKRAARAEARDIRMRELERQQKELSYHSSSSSNKKWGQIHQWMADTEKARSSSSSRSSSRHRRGLDDDVMSVRSYRSTSSAIRDLGSSKSRSSSRRKDALSDGLSISSTLKSSRSTSSVYNDLHGHKKASSSSSRKDLLTGLYHDQRNYTSLTKTKPPPPPSTSTYQPRATTSSSSTTSTGLSRSYSMASIYDDTGLYGSGYSSKAPSEYSWYSSGASSTRSSPVSSSDDDTVSSVSQERFNRGRRDSACSDFSDISESAADYFSRSNRRGSIVSDLDDLSIPDLDTLDEKCDKQYSDYSRPSSRCATPGLSAATLASLGGTSSRRGSADTGSVYEPDTSLSELRDIYELKDQIQDVEGRYMQGLKELKESLTEVEEKYKKAMVSNAQLDNDKANLIYQADTLKDVIEEMEEQMAEMKRELEEKSKELERQKHTCTVLQHKQEELKEGIRQRDELIEESQRMQTKLDALTREVFDLQETINWKDKKIGALERQKEYFDCIRNERDELRDELADIKGKSKAGEKHGLVIIPDGTPNGDVSHEPLSSGITLVSQEAAQVLESAGEGPLDVRLRKLAEEKDELLAQIRKLKNQLEEERQKHSKVDSAYTDGERMENGTDLHFIEMQRDANRQISEYKFKLSKAEQEMGTMEQNINRLEGQVSRYKASADNSEKIEDELKAEKRKLQRELRTALDKIEEMEMTNNHLVKRLEKMKANRNALLSQQ
ncbi:leucine-rich repeat flightless-interacting protein 2 isoform X1 [Amphiprion ocellaris]|uniref:Leucine-rich repeat flightless-interacting protein 2 n=1 Tax=Amphiprion ocellaris TaxID=80972 RepID=A0AAQ5ZKG8_AMPOC|nr:leucine-rich repeat flightless-interacting protein 2 isoform X1 [Amphiprion ocellaris]XP_054874554.1 leucine-rich repeat flightless-interacting protein 2 isoform X1 [Amphiprion ocellaris]XP_054874555.1 leucine-rich repeat flightless-interacting protein 2 isoform X1 [Amphiprion ocellaris]